MTQRALLVATVSRSLLRQSPVMWDALQAAGLELTFAAARDECSTALGEMGNFVELSLTRQLASVRPGSAVEAIKDLRMLLREPWDLVQVQSPIAGALVRLLAPREHAYPLVYVAHGFHFHTPKVSKADPAYRLVEGMLAGRSDAIITVSQDDYAHALQHWGNRTSVYRIPGGGVPTDELAALDRPVDRNLCLFVGDLNANKDVWLAVESVAAVRDRGVPARLRIFGTGPFEAELRAFAHDHSWCEIAGVTNSVTGIYAGAAVLLAPSKREGLPRVLVEALAAGIPVIARDNRGSREALRDGVGQLLPGEAGVDRWATAIETVLNGEVDARAKAAARRRAGEYDEPQVKSAYVKALADLGVGAGANLTTLTSR